MAKKRDTAEQTGFDWQAPEDARRDAQTQLQKSAVHGGLQSLIPRDELRPVIDYILNDMAESSMFKSAGSNVVPFPSKNAEAKRRGMQSVQVDDWQILVNGEYWEKPSLLGFDSLRAMVDQTPVLSAVIMTRQKQINRFCRPQESGEGPGFVVRHIDKDHQITPAEKESISLLQKFILNCGWEFKPRLRKGLRRDNFATLMAKLVRDTLTMDAAAIETEMKRDISLGIDGLYAVDGATVRLCTEDGYQGNDSVFALQVVQGRIRTAYTYNDLIYEPRNPQSSIITCGYGMGETELLVRVVTGFLNAMSYNINGFDKNAIPKGLLHLTGNYSQEDLQQFKRMWNAMVKGVNNAWALPVLVSKDQESKASFENFNIEFNEMMFSKWMTFLVSIICALYGMGPDEINFEAFAASKSSLSGSDTEEKLADSKEKGLKPLLMYFQDMLSDYVIGDFSDKYVLRFTGLDDEDQEKRHEMRKLTLTVNEARAQEGNDRIKEKWGDAPLNPSLVAVWQQEAMPQPGAEGEGGGEDFGQPQPDAGAPPDDQYGEPDPEAGDTGGEDDAGEDFGEAPKQSLDSDTQGNDYGKAFGLPDIYTLEP